MSATQLDFTLPSLRVIAFRALDFRLVELGFAALPCAIYCVPVKLELDRIRTLMVESSLPLHDHSFQFRHPPRSVLSIDTHGFKRH